MKAAAEGRNRDHKLRDNWELIKEAVMERALLSKFLQHPKLRQQLLLTESSEIIENTKNDSYWGDGGDGSGKNRLGILLMNIRMKINEYSRDPSVVLPPWIAYPGISQYDLFWRMGLGEDYLFKWSTYYLATDQAKYIEQFPAPEDWEGVYD